jgi:hypothetical protein
MPMVIWQCLVPSGSDSGSRIPRLTVTVLARSDVSPVVGQGAQPVHVDEAVRRCKAFMTNGVV